MVALGRGRPSVKLFEFFGRRGLCAGLERFFRPGELCVCLAYEAAQHGGFGTRKDRQIFGLVW